MNELINKIKTEPLVLTLGICVLMIAVMGTSVRHVSSASYLILLVSSLFVIRHWRTVFDSLSGSEKLFLLSLLFYLISAGLSYYNVGDADKYIKLLERYLRFTLCIPIFLMMVKIRVSLINYLYTGAILSGPFLLLVALRHVYLHPEVPAQGYYHHIIFGQLAMLNVGVMLAFILSRTLSRKYLFIVMVSMVCGIVTAMLSQARGVWLVLPIYVLVAVFFTLKDKRLSARWLLAIIVMVVLIGIFTPVSNVIKQRTNAAVDEIVSFYHNDQYISSVGTRLAMWDIAMDVWLETPLLGTGPGDFDDEIIELQKNGQYVGMDVHNSTHNIYIQSLVGTGIVGLAALLLAVIIMPAIVLLKTADREAKLLGSITVMSFAVYGLSESWTLRLSIISVFLVYISVITSHAHIVDRREN